MTESYFKFNMNLFLKVLIYNNKPITLLKYSKVARIINDEMIIDTKKQMKFIMEPLFIKYLVSVMSLHLKCSVVNWPAQDTSSSSFLFKLN